MKRVLRWTGQALAWSVLLGAAAIIVIAVIVPRITGAQPYVIQTGSMEPGMPPGTLVIVRPVEASTLQTGDVVTLQLRSGRREFVTHRIVAVGAAGDGEPRFTTQGDANNAPDTETRLPDQIRGKRWYSVPYAGYLQQYVGVGQREAIVRVIAVGLIVYAAWMFLSAFLGRRRRDIPAAALNHEAETASLTPPTSDPTSTRPVVTAEGP